ncbi:right-handed parallel beta-helix repeat-containing protein [Odoribacter sp. OttesenSCG-928-G04]|nr:right-handed parallel beta-helix repeat-containing protein [Odoribacter sp. OttesenSCG-928-G04]MDL2331121.1 right-handed parallel beta-helix repeat-containing protein [Odoribacter sp. OttesenSCG-928-A06]
MNVYAQGATLRYVREGGSGDRSGRDWSNASADLQAMINESDPSSGDMVYVAAGVYYAMAQGDLAVDERGVGAFERRYRSFVMKSGVKVYGGFNAQNPESSHLNRGRGEYGWQMTHKSVLSGATAPGEEGLADNWVLNEQTQSWVPSGYIRDNVLHVVWFASAGFDALREGEPTPALALSQETVLDGFTIEGGSADGVEFDGGIPGHSARFGGGVYLVENGVLRNCVVEKNYALAYGGGVFVNYGGSVSDCFISSNASPGYNYNKNGYGGGVYLLGKGMLERSFVVNNTSRQGAGVYVSKGLHTVPYDAVIETSIIANNTATYDGGGVYACEAGVLTSSYVLYNNTMSAAVMDYGKTGGVYCDRYLVLTNTVLYGNNTSSNTRQVYVINSTGATETTLASVQVHHCAIEDKILSTFGMATQLEVFDLTRFDQTGRTVDFILDPNITGVRSLFAIDPANYLNTANWDKTDCSILLKMGATFTEAPFLNETARVNIPQQDINGTSISGRPDIGAYFTDSLEIADQDILFVDNSSTLCGDGRSWDSPLRFISVAIEALKDRPHGGVVYVKEGTYFPVQSSGQESSYCLTMRSKVNLLGGYPSHLSGQDLSERNPVVNRTILSGDVGIKNDLSDNLNHLVVFDIGTQGTATLDGFTLMYVNSLNDTHHGNNFNQVGGAIRVLSGTARIQNCIIENNIATTGAALLQLGGDVRMNNCIINNNTVAEGGAVLDLKPGVMKDFNIQYMTIVQNEGIGIRGGTLAYSVLWDNTIQYSGTVFGHDEVNYRSVIQGRDAISADNEDVAGPRFENITLGRGVVVQGHNTENGEPAMFRPGCGSVLIDIYPVWGTKLSTDIVSADRIRGRSGYVDVGAFVGVCGNRDPMGDERIYHVRTDGGWNGGTSWATAVNVGGLVQMIDNGTIKSGDQIWFAAGTHQPVNNALKMLQGVDVYGGFPATGTPGMEERDARMHVTIIKPPRNNHAALNQPVDFVTETTWDGLVFQGGVMNAQGTDGAGVRLRRGGRLVDCIIRDNKIIDVSSKNGGGVYNSGGVLENCIITGNTIAGGSGAGLYMTSGAIYNCLITGNTGSNQGSAAYIDGGQVAFYNVTIADNSGGNSHLYIGQTGSLALYNSVVVAGISENPTIVDVGKTTGVPLKVFNCCIRNNNYPGNENINADPLFVSPTDFRLQANSPCINGGTFYPQGVEMTEKDLGGEARIQNCAVDIGAYEYGGGSNSLFPSIKGDTAILYVTLLGDGLADGSSWEDAACGSLLQSAINVLATYTNPDVHHKQVWVGRGVNNYNVESNFYPTEASESGSNRYKTFHMRGGVSVMGHFYGNENSPQERVLRFGYNSITILNGDINKTPGRKNDDAYHVVTFDPEVFSQPAVLENFVVRNGNANHQTDVEYRDGGGIVIRPGGNVQNCYVHDCYALRYGGGVYMEGNEDDSDFPNSITTPPIVSRLSSSVVVGCESSIGGGVYAGSHAFVIGNTIVRNKAERGGGLAFNWPPAIIQSSVLWHNEANLRKNIYGETDRPFQHRLDAVLPLPVYPVNYSAIEGELVKGVSNVQLSSDNVGDADAPFFNNPEIATLQNGGWKLQNHSPLIDKGLHAGWAEMNTTDQLLHWYQLSSLDMTGGQRVKTVNESFEKEYMDIGAYEAENVVSLQADVHNRIYVTRVRRGTMNGSSWANATDDLQAALNYFRDNQLNGEVWVQGGHTYIPFKQIDGTTLDDREVSFVLNPYASIYGGFKGDAVHNPAMNLWSESSLDQRLRYDYNENGIIEEFEFRYETILDGTINQENSEVTNSYHVLYYQPAESVQDEIIVNGFIITNGQAMNIRNASEWERKRSGGGLYAMAPVRVECCIFRNNDAEQHGGAVYMHGGKIMYSSFEGNRVQLGRGGSVWIENGSVINSNIFSSTSEEGLGGGIFAANSELLNVVVVKNEAPNGSGLYTEYSNVVNTVVWGNEARRRTGRQVAGSGHFSYCALPDEYLTGVDVSHPSNIRLRPENNVPGGPRFVRPIEVAGYKGYEWNVSWRTAAGSALMNRGNTLAWTTAGLPDSLNYILDKQTGILVKQVRFGGDAIDIGTYEQMYVKLNAFSDTIYVRSWENPNVEADGSSWEKATTDIQGAIRILEESTSTGNKEIWVAQGVYLPLQKRDSDDENSRSYVINRGGIKIYGGFPDDGLGMFSPTKADRNPTRYPTLFGDETVLSDHIMYISDHAVGGIWLDGISVKGGRITGVYAGNSTEMLTLNRCLFTQNGELSDTSAALYSGRPVTIYNSLFFNNNSTALNLFSAYLLNNTVAGNKGGGVKLRDSAPRSTIMNTVMWGNDVYQYTFPAGACRFTYNAVMNELVGDPADHNLSLGDNNYVVSGPRFRSLSDPSGIGFKPGCGSPLIDRGNTTATTILPDSKDLLNENRVLSGTIDIGAFESDLVGTLPDPPLIMPTTDTTICQYTPLTLNAEARSGIRTVWFNGGNTVGTASKLTLYNRIAGGFEYYALSEDITTGCRSEIVEIEVTVNPVFEVDDLSGPAIHCTGNSELILLFTPVPGYTYDLYQNDIRIRTGISSDSVNVGTIDTAGTYTYYLVSRNPESECADIQSNIFEVIVEDSQYVSPDDLKWDPTSGTINQLVCRGDALVPIVFQYALGVTVLNMTLPPGMSCIKETTQRTVTIRGIPNQGFTYMLKTLGGECSSASQAGAVVVKEKSKFILGIK